MKVTTISVVNDFLILNFDDSAVAYFEASRERRGDYSINGISGLVIVKDDKRLCGQIIRPQAIDSSFRHRTCEPYLLADYWEAAAIELDRDDTPAYARPIGQQVVQIAPDHIALLRESALATH